MQLVSVRRCRPGWSFQTTICNRYQADPRDVQRQSRPVFCAPGFLKRNGRGVHRRLPPQRMPLYYRRKSPCLRHGAAVQETDAACIGINPERLRIEQMSAGEGIRFAEMMNDFSSKLRELGPLGKAEGIDADRLKFKLQAVTKLIPYIRLVERERLRVHLRHSGRIRRVFPAATK